MTTIDELQAEIRGLEGAVDYWRRKTDEVRNENMRIRQDNLAFCDENKGLREERLEMLKLIDSLQGTLAKHTPVAGMTSVPPPTTMQIVDTIPGFHRTYAQIGKGEWRYWAPLPDGRWLWYPVWVPDEDEKEVNDE